MKKVISLYKNGLVRIIAGLVFFIPAFILDRISASQPTHTLYIIATLLYVIALLIVGIPVFLSAVRGIFRGDLLDEKFLMSIASIGAMIIGDMSEGVAVMLFFLVGEYFEHRAVAHSRKSIKALMSICPDEATLLTENGEEAVDAEDVPVGSTIIVRAGERIPIDAEVISGTADIDTSALTGESVPRPASPSSTVESGAVVLNGVITCKTLRPAEESAAARILELVENANETKSKEESFITRFSRYYTPIVVGLAVVMAILPPLVSEMTFTESVYSALTFLVISCPCALVISVPMAFFGGIGGAASKGILFKGGNVFSPLANADTFAFDKTGTLTTGSFRLGEIKATGISENELLYYAASAEYGSNHPIATAIKATVEAPSVPTDYHEIAGRGVVATVDGKRVIVGNSELLCEHGISTDDAASTAALHIAVENAYSGSIFVIDDIKTEAESAIKRIKSSGAKRTVMLSGDRYESAARVASAVGIDELHASLLPEEKYSRLREIIADSRSVVYVGDGINDAPALATANVGVAMGAIGSDSAIEAADVVIMSDKLDRLPTAIKIAKKTVSIAKMNIAFALAVKGLILVLSAIGYANMWLAVFADVGVAVIAILNSIRTLRVKE
ncbi:MAG: cadmium-translocating P-type ATPase [Clostridia bacterium]|nr:cadmium-translocating P-type ATPase [Clostridia bacterium]